MRVFLDENMPRPLRRILAEHEVSWVENEGWKGATNGVLLALVAQSFDVLLTSDANMSYQNELARHDLSVVVLPTNNLTLLRANADAVQLIVDELADSLEPDHPVLVEVDWKGRRTSRRLDLEMSHTVDLPSVPAFGR